jgi:hypothetical protein
MEYEPSPGLFPGSAMFALVSRGRNSIPSRILQLNLSISHLKVPNILDNVFGTAAEAHRPRSVDIKRLRRLYGIECHLPPKVPPAPE